MEIREQIRLRLHPTPARETAIRRTIVAYAIACSIVRDKIAEGTPANYRALQASAYHQIRLRSGLPAQLTISAIREALRQPVCVGLPPVETVLLQGGKRSRDFRVLPDSRLSLSTVDGRLNVRYSTSPRSQAILQDKSWHAAEARIEDHGVLRVKLDMMRELGPNRIVLPPIRPGNSVDHSALALLLACASTTEQRAGVTVLTIWAADVDAANWIRCSLGGRVIESHHGARVRIVGPAADRVLVTQRHGSSAQIAQPEPQQTSFDIDRRNHVEMQHVTIVELGD